MRRPLLLLLIALCTTPAMASSPEPSREDIARAVQTCTVDGAFGIRFGERISPAMRFTKPLPPFAVPSVIANGGSGVTMITGSASFAKAPMSQEDRIALAGWFFHKLDQEVAAKRKFAKREAQHDLALYTFAEGFMLEVVQLGTEVRLICMRGSRDSISPNPLK